VVLVSEVSRFVKCLPSSTGEIHHYDTEVRKNNFGEVLVSGDKILWRNCRRWRVIFLKEEQDMSLNGIHSVVCRK
jgi:hypothetical protein